MLPPSRSGVGEARWHSRWWFPLALIALLAAIAGGLWLYYRYNPAQHLIAPKCPLLALTGYKCPSCGAQRFLHALLNGRPLVAIAYNYFLALALPYLALLALAALGRRVGGMDSPAAWLFNRLSNRWVLRGYIFAFFAWWIARNILAL